MEIIVTGMHMLNKFGLTINELVKDKVKISDKIEIYSETTRDKYIDFTLALKKISKTLKSKEFTLRG